ncbi:chromosome segregation protein SMC [Candidatus Neomarinimicrobiota bacterium]
MHISQLVINGFKTFNNKTTLEFGDGITAVIGPNGCGKTNIVDAIRWVLGEQKHATLRSSRMEDIIFNGAKGIKPLSMCDVYLTVKNDKGKLPIEYTDVEIGRRLYRNGESDYFINRTACRLKDINNLFIDTGMGADSYSVIELKMIEQILSETDYDRKFLFEEAAGINKYKTQRRLSIKKFDATKFDLERINDIINEVDAKVKGLNLQLKRFKRHATLAESLKSNALDLSTLQINKYLTASEPLRKKIKEFSHLRDTKISNQDFSEAELSTLRALYDQQVGEINFMRSDLEKREDERVAANQKILIWQEQIRSAAAAVERLKSETESNKARIEKYRINITEKIRDLDSIIPKIDEQLTKFKFEQEKFDNIENTYKLEQKVVDEIQSERWELQKKISENKSLTISTESSIKERIALKDRLNQRIISETDLVEQLRTQEKAYDDKYKSANAKSRDLTNQKASIEEDLIKLNQNLVQVKSLKQSQVAKLESLANQLQFYEELMVTHADLPTGLRYVIDNKIETESIIGTIADIFSTNEKYEVALNAGLGEFVHCLVCKDLNSVNRILKDIQGKKTGKISLIPFEAVKNRSIELPAVPKNDEIIGRASDLIKSKSQFTIVAELLFGDTLIVKDLSKAILDPNLEGWTLIDLKGASFNNLIFKKPGSFKGTIIGRLEKIEILKTEIGKVEKNIKVHDNEVSDLVSKKIELDNNLVFTIGQIDSNKGKFEKLNSDYQRIKFEIDSKEKNIFDTKTELTEISQSISDLQISLQSLLKNVEQSEKQFTLIQRKLDNASEKLLKSRSTRDLYHQTIQDLRIELLNLENDRDNLKSQKKTAENTITEIEERQLKIIAEIKILNEQSKERADEINIKEKELIAINVDLKKSKSLLDLKEQTYRDTYRSIEEIENKIKSEQKNRESILEELKSCEIAIVEYQQKINAITERISERYNAVVPHKTTIDKTEEELASDIARLERSIESIGPVNMAVQVEVEEEIKRLEHLTKQRDDLVESEVNLRESIEKIDRVARKQFRETFEQIKVNFENLFTVFFEGGQGTLDLIGDPDPLEADIAIRAQPPGKRNQTLRMLSAGEKSLTAIALLFSIYQYKPSPYCILDEIDAPLDDTNVGKFTRALRSFAKDTQFIVVTHNKLTMEVANYLYGVTMEKKGVSKLVSVKFD